MLVLNAKKLHTCLLFASSLIVFDKATLTANIDHKLDLFSMIH